MKRFLVLLVLGVLIVSCQNPMTSGGGTDPVEEVPIDDGVLPDSKCYTMSPIDSAMLLNADAIIDELVANEYSEIADYVDNNIANTIGISFKAMVREVLFPEIVPDTDTIDHNFIKNYLKLYKVMKVGDIICDENSDSSRIDEMVKELKKKGKTIQVPIDNFVNATEQFFEFKEAVADFLNPNSLEMQKQYQKYETLFKVAGISNVANVYLFFDKIEPLCDILKSFTSFLGPVSGFISWGFGILDLINPQKPGLSQELKDRFDKIDQTLLDIQSQIKGLEEKIDTYRLDDLKDEFNGTILALCNWASVYTDVLDGHDDVGDVNETILQLTNLITEFYRSAVQFYEMDADDSNTLANKILTDPTKISLRSIVKVNAVGKLDGSSFTYHDGIFKHNWLYDIELENPLKSLPTSPEVLRYLANYINMLYKATIAFNKNLPPDEIRHKLSEQAKLLLSENLAPHIIPGLRNLLINKFSENRGKFMTMMEENGLAEEWQIKYQNSGFVLENRAFINSLPTFVSDFKVSSYSPSTMYDYATIQFYVPRKVKIDGKDFYKANGLRSYDITVADHSGAQSVVMNFGGAPLDTPIAYPYYGDSLMATSLSKSSRIEFSNSVVDEISEEEDEMYISSGSPETTEPYLQLRELLYTVDMQLNYPVVSYAASLAAMEVLARSLAL
ncbi:MAG: hypothetical protein JW969_14515 [Spirochaetales bacterium]|nr:hypothetical protein [Spirochaetales bacterium]